MTFTIFKRSVHVYLDRYFIHLLPAIYVTRGKIYLEGSLEVEAFHLAFLNIQVTINSKKLTEFYRDLGKGGIEL